VKVLSSRFVVAGAFLFAIVALLASTARAQEKEIKRSWGLSATLQSPQPVLIVPIWMGPKFVIAPNLGVAYVKNTGTVLAVGLTFRVYQSTGRLVPYWGVRGGSLITMPTGGGSTSSNGAGVFYGGEFFINSRFSFAVEEQVNSTFSSPLTITTATALLATIHF